ncbi:hypothetical protein VTI74DRAFT_2475 [Chaetomium olivicolor]
MMPARTNTADSSLTLRDDLSKVESNTSTQTPALPWRFDRQQSNPVITALAPRPASTQQLPRKKSHLRLRSESGLALHTNQGAFRQYTDYNPDGSLPSRPSPPVRTLSYDGNSSVEDFDIGRHRSTELKGFISHGRVLPDFFEPAVIKLAFTNPSTAQRLRRFAETRHSTSDIDFLMKVEEYSRALGDLISTMSYISSNFTGTTATSPLGLPAEVTSAQRSNKKFCARTALPALDRLYQEAKSTVEERLSQNLYPEFIKYQLSQCLITSLSMSRFVTEEFKAPYPGLGDAFCLTDPLKPDDPIVYASDGLAAMSGYDRSELVGKNCRLLQGVATDADAACRLSQAVTAGREVTELILNYRPDGTAYWNLLFICPLMEHGSVRYFLGAQVNVSEYMGSDYRDIMGVLNFGPPLNDSPLSRSPPSPDRLRQSTDTLDLEQADDHQSLKRTFRRQRFFKRFHRKPPSSRPSSPSRPSTASVSETPTTDENLPSSPSSRSFRTPLSPQLEQQQCHPVHHHITDPSPFDEHSTPYSRLFVMRYVPPTVASETTPHRRNKLRSEHRRPHCEHHPTSLPIAYTSSCALSLLGLKQDDAHTLADRDIFEVLASPAYLGSPSVSRALRQNILNRIGEGRAVSVDVMAPEGHHQHRHPSPVGFGAERPGVGKSKTTGTGAAAAGGSVGEEPRPRLSETLDRGAEFLSQRVFSNHGPGKPRRFVSSWVPLKDAEGKVGWVVCVLTPVDG